MGRSLIVAIATGVVLTLVPLAGAEAQSDADSEIFTPKPEQRRDPERRETPVQKETPRQEPAASTSGVSLVGRWHVVQSGGGVCNELELEINSSSANSVIGTTIFPGIPGRIVDGSVNGQRVSLVTSYTDIFGNPVTETWRGTLSGDGRTISGKIEGSWANGCAFTASRN